MAISRVWVEEAGMTWIANGEAFDESVSNRPHYKLFGNVAFLYDRMRSSFQQQDFRHFRVADITTDAGTHDSNSGLSSLVVSADDLATPPASDYRYNFYQPGAQIWVNGKGRTIHHVDYPVSGGETNWLIWVYDTAATVWPVGTLIEAGEPVLSKMFYVPRTRIPASGIATGFPATDIVVGGFWLDKFENSGPDGSFLSSGNKAQFAQASSQAGVSPIKTTTFPVCRYMAGNRTMNGFRSRLMRGRDFGELLMIVMYQQGSWRGNDSNGRFHDDTDVVENHGAPDPESILPIVGVTKRSVCLTGTGPFWTHNTMESGVADLYGNLREFVDMKQEAGKYVHQKHCGVIKDAPVGAAEVYVELEQPEAWTIGSAIDTDVYFYRQATGEYGMATALLITEEGKGIYKMSLSGLLPEALEPGDFGTTFTEHCIIPNGSYFEIEGGLEENINHVDHKYYYDPDTVLTSRADPDDFVLVGDTVQFFGTRGGNPAIEQMVVNFVDLVNHIVGFTGRAANGTVAITTDAPAKSSVLCPQMVNGALADPTDPVHTGKVLTFRAEADLANLLLPATVEAANTNTHDFKLRLHGERVAARGTSYSDMGIVAAHYLEFLLLATGASPDIGFRSSFCRFPHVISPAGYGEPFPESPYDLGLS